MTDTAVYGTSAIALHDRGFHVFPADHPDHRECIGLHGPDSPCDGQRGKHPAVKFGTWAVAVTPKMIELAWAKRGGLANIAVACGPSGLVVFDEDEFGELQRWCDAYGVTLPDDTYMVTTGRGKHYYFRWDHSQRRIGLVPKAVEGYKLDIRGEGGYAIGEGSQHVTGAIYTGNGQPIADLPQEVAQLLLAGAPTNGQPHAAAGGQFWEEHGGRDFNNDKIGFHDRHQALVSYAGRLRKSGLSHTEALPAFEQRWLLCEQPEGQIPEAKFHSTDCPYPVTWEEAQAKLRDVFERYPAGQNLDGGEEGGTTRQGMPTTISGPSNSQTGTAPPTSATPPASCGPPATGCATCTLGENGSSTNMAAGSSTRKTPSSPRSPNRCPENSTNSPRKPRSTIQTKRKTSGRGR